MQRGIRSKWKCKKIAEEMIKKGAVKKIKEEKGNLKYDYFISLNNPKTTSYWLWKSRSDIDLHRHSSMMPKIIGLRERYLKETEILSGDEDIVSKAMMRLPKLNKAYLI